MTLFLLRAVACTLLCGVISPLTLFTQSDLARTSETPARGSVSVGLQYLLDDGTTPPSVKPSSPSIEYPDLALVQGIEGSVEVKVLVDETGSVAKVNVVSSSNPLFTDRTVETVQEFQFTPAAVNGKATEFWLRMDIGFKTEESWSSAFHEGTDKGGEGWAVIGDNEQPKIDHVAFRENLVYPEEAFKRGARGVVVIRTRVSVEGEVVAMEVEGTADAVLAEAALRAIAKTPFRAGTEAGEAKEMWTMIPVNFDISNGEDISGIAGTNSAIKGSSIEVPTYDIQELYGNFKLTTPLTGPVDVKLRVLIDKEGSVEQVLITDEIDAFVSRAAADAVKQTTFTPGKQGGETIPVWITVDMRVKPR